MICAKWRRQGFMRHQDPGLWVMIWSEDYRQMVADEFAPCGNEVLGGARGRPAQLCLKGLRESIPRRRCSIWALNEEYNFMATCFL